MTTALPRDKTISEAKRLRE